jgi:hypothetical protein
MTFSSRRRAKRLMAGAFLVLLGFGNVAPSQVRAACGLDNASNFRRSTRILVHDLALEKTRTSEQFDSSSSGVPHGDRSCSGLACSQGREMPNAPASPLSSHSRSDDGFCTTSRSGYAATEFTEYQTNPCNPHPYHHSFPIERPPRP